MNLEKALLATPVEEWKADLAIALDWFDGARQGICRLSHPAVEFYFDLLDERNNPNGLDDRLYRLSEVPEGSTAAVQEACAILGHPTGPVWVPIWRFPDADAKDRAERTIRSIEDRKRPTKIVVFSRDAEEFLGCWSMDEVASNGSDWFTRLHVPAPIGLTE